jgi:glutathione peroxidase
MMESIYDFSIPALDSFRVEAGANAHEISLGEFRDRVLLIVNTASRCGFTPQYAELEAIYRRFRERGFEVLGFPCNQFGGQEPGSAAEIGAFCERKFGVTFPLFSKIDVNGPHAHPLYQLLKEKKPGIFGTRRIKWNFTKFLVDRKGEVVARYRPATRPEKLGSAIEALLGREQERSG